MIPLLMATFFRSSSRPVATSTAAWGRWDLFRPLSIRMFPSIALRPRSPIAAHTVWWWPQTRSPGDRRSRARRLGADAHWLRRSRPRGISQGEERNCDHALIAGRNRAGWPPADARRGDRAGGGGALERGLICQSLKPRRQKSGDEGVARAGGVDRLDLRRVDSPALARLPPPRAPAAPRLTTTSG